MLGKKEFGDYQTPLEFAKNICDFLLNYKKVNPSVVIEPNCGIGNFIESSFIFNAQKYIGIDINKEYCDYCKQRFKGHNVDIINENFFDFDLKKLLSKQDTVLIIGNPPWVNNSFLSSIDSKNLPHKTNLKNLKGLDAITGASNFDICEYIITQLLQFFKNSTATIAMLCKTTVARNIFREVRNQKISFTDFEIIEFDANKIFGINASACLLYIELSSTKDIHDECKVLSLDNPEECKYSIKWENNKLTLKDGKSDYDFDGKCCFEWRQGIKHDCSPVMELSLNDGKFVNGLNEVVDIEPDIVFPLVKSSMFKTAIVSNFTKYVIVTQKKIGENTEHLQYDVPRTWNYLNAHLEYFTKRKSTIYKNSHVFSIFGIGDYSYSQYKVGISGFYKKPFFSLLYSESRKPVMTDDTSYYISFDSYDDAYVAMLFLNSPIVTRCLLNIAFVDSKRPFTKKVLDRIDFSKICNHLPYEELQKTEKMLNLNNYLTKEMLNHFIQIINNDLFSYQQISCL